MHTDPELIGLLALGEHAGTEHDRSHAETCPDCSDELRQLRHVVTLGRSAADEDLVEPGPAVWARIREELALEPAAESAPDQPGLPARFAIGGDLTGEAHLTPAGPSWSHASGAATLSTDEQGRRVLQVALHVDLPSSGVRQAWLLHRDNPAMRQSLGILDGLNGLWTVDHAVDLEQYAILDISQQGVGDTEHSGNSLVRGELTLIS